MAWIKPHLMLPMAVRHLIYLIIPAKLYMSEVSRVAVVILNFNGKEFLEQFLLLF